MNPQVRDVDLDRYRDGELSPWRRWWIARCVARDPALQRRLESLDTLGGLLREQAASIEEPDLWEAVRARLATAPRPAPRSEPPPEPASGSIVPAWLGAAFATAVVAVVMAASVLPGDDASMSSVRWLDSKGKPVMVLRDDPEATIIWVIETPSRSTRGGRDAMA